MLAAAIASEAFGTSMLKASNGFTEIVFTALFAVGYIASFAFLTFALKGLPLGTAYGIWSGSGVSIASVIGMIVWRDPLNSVVIAGIALVIVGVVLLETSTSETSADAPE